MEKNTVFQHLLALEVSFGTYQWVLSSVDYSTVPVQYDVILRSSDKEYSCPMDPVQGMEGDVFGVRWLTIEDKWSSEDEAIARLKKELKMESRAGFGFFCVGRDHD